MCGSKESSAEAADPLPGALGHLNMGFTVIWTQSSPWWSQAEVLAGSPQQGGRLEGLRHVSFGTLPASHQKCGKPSPLLENVSILMSQQRCWQVLGLACR